MDYSPRVQRLIAQIEAVQLKADCSAAQLAAEVRQILLAATVDIEQRWQFMNPEDRVSAITDAITVIRIYNRAFADGTAVADTVTRLTGKFLTEATPLTDAASLQVATMLEDVCPPDDVFARIVGYARYPEDAVEMVDAIETLLTLIRDYADSVAASDIPAWELDRPYSEGVQATEVAALGFATQVQELVSAAENFARTVDFVRATAEVATATDAPAKTFATAFFDVGGLYAVPGYFAADYVEAGTGPAVYDTFSYTLA